jgi:hypothetical protein
MCLFLILSTSLAHRASLFCIDVSGHDNTPAPDLYQPTQAHTPRAATHIMAARHPELTQDDTPGPGATRLISLLCEGNRC